MNDLTEKFIRSTIERFGVEEFERMAETIGRVISTGNYLNRPAYLNETQVATLSRDATMLHWVLESLPDRLVGSNVEEFARFCRCSDRQAEGVVRTAGKAAVSVSRVDCYESASGFRALEMNTIAVGGLEIGELGKLYERQRAVNGFVRPRHLRFLDPLKLLCRALRKAAAPSELDRAKKFALVNLRGELPRNDRSLALISGVLNDYGIDALTCHLTDLEYRGGRVYARGSIIDVVLRFFLIEDLDSDDVWQSLEPLIDAHEAGAVQIVAPFAADLVGSKRALALMWMHRQQILSDSERRFVERFVPWSTLLSETIELPSGSSVRAHDYCLAHKDDLVYKPGMSNCGHGVLIGRETPLDIWVRVIETGIDQGDVIQSHVTPLPELYFEGAPPRRVVRHINWGVFLVDSSYAGLLVRGELSDLGGLVTSETGALFAACFEPTPPRGDLTLGAV